MNNPDTDGTPFHARELLVLATCCAGLVVQTTALNGVVVALPRIENGLAAGIRQGQWITAGFQVVVGSLVFVGAATAARFGLKRVFTIALAAFSVTSLLCALAPSAEALIAARLLQAAASAALVPVGLSILATEFPQPARQAAVASIWSAVVACSGPLMSIVAGVTVTALGWRALFFGLALVGALAGVGATWVLPEARPGQRRRVDLAGLTLLALVVAAVLAAAIGVGGTAGWSRWAPLSLAAVLATVFTVVERGRADPLVDRTLTVQRSFRSAVTFSFALYLLFNGFLFCNTLYLQQMRGLTAVQTAFVHLPAALCALLASPVGVRLGRLGRSRSVMPGSLACIAGGLAVLAVTCGAPPLPVLVPAGCLLGIGVGLGYGLVLVTVLTAAGPEHAATASASMSTATLTGGAMGAAAMGSIAAAAALSRLHGFAPATGPNSALARAAQGGARLAGSIPARAAPGSPPAIAYQSFTHGLQTAYAVSASFCLALVVVAPLLWRRQPMSRTEPGDITSSRIAQRRRT